MANTKRKKTREKLPAVDFLIGRNTIYELKDVILEDKTHQTI